MERKCLVLCSVLAAGLVRYCAASGQGGSQCFTHDDCTDPAQFCAWTTCKDSNLYLCSECQPCTQCRCDSDSIDFECPQTKCPGQPYNSVRFLQGEFYNFSNIPGESYSCLRRFVVSGNIFSLSQLPIFSQHPATVANFSEPPRVSTLCPTYVRSGILKEVENLELQVIVSSEGNNRPYR